MSPSRPFDYRLVVRSSQIPLGIAADKGQEKWRLLLFRILIGYDLGDGVADLRLLANKWLKRSTIKGSILWRARKTMDRGFAGFLQVDRFDG